MGVSPIFSSQAILSSEFKSTPISRTTAQLRRLIWGAISCVLASIKKISCLGSLIGMTIMIWQQPSWMGTLTLWQFRVRWVWFSKDIILRDFQGWRTKFCSRINCSLAKQTRSALFHFQLTNPQSLLIGRDNLVGPFGMALMKQV